MRIVRIARARRGEDLDDTSVELHRTLNTVMRKYQEERARIRVILNPDVLKRLKEEDEELLVELERRYAGRLMFRGDPSRFLFLVFTTRTICHYRRREEHDSFTNLFSSSTTRAVSVGFPATHTGSTTRGFGQVGAGLEIRLTPHIGWMSDFSWNVVNGPDNNFGMARSGVTFAF
jgi:hypothetical protein